MPRGVRVDLRGSGEFANSKIMSERKRAPRGTPRNRAKSRGLPAESNAALRADPDGNAAKRAESKHESAQGENSHRETADREGATAIAPKAASPPTARWPTAIHAFTGGRNVPKRSPMRMWTSGRPRNFAGLQYS